MVDVLESQHPLRKWYNQNSKTTPAQPFFLQVWEELKVLCLTATVMTFAHSPRRTGPHWWCADLSGWWAVGRPLTSGQTSSGRGIQEASLPCREEIKQGDRQPELANPNTPPFPIHTLSPFLSLSFSPSLSLTCCIRSQSCRLQPWTAVPTPCPIRPLEPRAAPRLLQHLHCLSD